MSCPSCQVGGRRLPSLPLGYMAKAKRQLNQRNFRKALVSAGAAGGTSQRLCTHSPPLEDHDGMLEYLEQHSNIVEEFVMKNVSQNEIEKWLIRKSQFKTGKRESQSAAPNQTPQTKEDEQQSLSQWKFCVHKDKRRMLEKLTTEIHLKRSKSHVINELIENTSLVIHASRYTFYLVDDSEKYLFCYSESANDVQNSSQQQEIATSGTAAAYTALQKELVYAIDILGDDRFPAGTGRDGTDLSIICYPILKNNGSLFAIVEFVKDVNTSPFGSEDVEIASSYMAWGTIAILYAEVADQIHYHADIEQFICQFGMELVERSKSIMEMSKLILEFAVKATQCDYYIMYILDKSNNEFYSNVTNIKLEDSLTEIRFPDTEGIPSFAIHEDDIVNVRDPYSNSHFSRNTDQKTGITTKNILAISFSRNNESIGVIELLNKQNGVFSSRDECIMKLCRTYCNLTFSFKVLSSNAGTKSKEITLLRESLGYQARPSNKDLKEIEHPLEPVDEPDDLFQLSFNMYQHSDQFGLWFMKIAKNLFDRCEFKYCDKVLLKFTATVRNFYHDFAYHNWEHAFSVAQFVCVLMDDVWDEFRPLEKIAMFVGALCHDIDHRGYNNAFMFRTKHPLATFYNTGSVMEYHHSYMAQLVLEQDGCDLFYSLNKEEKAEVSEYMKKVIIATDLYTHFARKIYMETLLRGGEFDWKDTKHRHTAGMLMITLSDLCGSSKPWEVHRLSSMKVFEEFFSQGEQEIAMGYKPIRMFVSREDFPLNQVGFLNSIVKPTTDLMEPLIPVLSQAQAAIASNISRWEEIIESRDANDGASNEQKIGELRIPNSELQRRSLSFVMYNCSGVPNDFH